jgi:multidrug efflux pump subunit AcrB
VTISLALAIIVAGYWAFTQLNQELVPNIEFPQTFIVIQNGGASSDQMLSMYSIPIEEKTQSIEGVVNVETVSNDGFGFAIVRNEFGLEQQAIVDEIETRLNDIPLPTRRVDPPAGQSAAALIGELSPEALAWLYQWAQAEEVGFITQLNSETLLAFSPQALAVLPEEALAELSEEIRAEILATDRAPLPAFDPAAPPALPESWQGDPRFSTTEDLAEMTTVRSLGGVFNDFYTDGYLVGPLGKTDDVTVADVELFLALEAQCRALNLAAAPDGEDTCSFIADLNAETLLAFPPEVIAALPADYLSLLDPIERRSIAEIRAAEALSGQTQSFEAVLLPDAWRVEFPRIITFSFSDFPVGVVSVDSDSLTADELRDLVENEMAPALRDVDLVASVTFEGGEIIPVILDNAARAELGLPLLEVPADSGSPAPSAEASTAETTEETSEDSTPAQEESTEDEGEEQATPTPGTYPEGPALPPVWGAIASLAGVDEFNSADDIFLVVGGEISGVQIDSAAAFINALAEQPTAAPLLDTLTPEILAYLAEQEPGFIEALNPDILAQVSGEAPVASPSLGEAWAQLSANPLLAAQPLTTVEELLAAGGAEVIIQILTATADPAFQAYGVRLMDSLSPEALAALVEADPDFLTTLAAQAPEALRWLSRPALESPALGDFLASSDQTELVADLQAILDGEATAAERELAQTAAAEVFVDKNAPALPASWLGVAPFVNAAELDTADDIFNVPGYAGAADLISRFALGQDGAGLVVDLTTENWVYLGQIEPNFWNDLNATAIRLLNQETVDISQLPEAAQTRIQSGGEVYKPTASVTRTNQNPSLVVNIFKDGDANTVIAWENADEVLAEFDTRDDVQVTVVFEQASFITKSLDSVVVDGSLGAVFAIIIILIFMNLSFRSTVVISVSIPGSIMFGFLMIHLVPGTMNDLLTPLLEQVGRDNLLGGLLVVLIRLFPADLTLNIMTLSGMTVAVGRVVDDSIVSLENIYRNIGLMKDGDNKRTVIEAAVGEIALPILSATVTTMLIFIPLGLFGGVTGAFFLPFGLAGAYALVGSYLMSITVVPVLCELFISKENIPPEDELLPLPAQATPLQTGWNAVVNTFIGGVLWLSRTYSAAISWSLKNLVNRLAVVAGAIVIFFFGIFLMANRPVQFLPPFGDPTASVNINLPREVDGQPITIADTNARVVRLEAWLLEQKAQGVKIKSVQAIVGSTGNQDGFGVNGGVNETAATFSIAVEDQATLDSLIPLIREQGQIIFDDLNNNGVLDYQEEAGGNGLARSNVRVSGAGGGGGFGGFALEVQGTSEDTTLTQLAAYNEVILQALQETEGLANVELESSLGGGDSPVYVRIDGVAALRYTAEVESDDTIGTSTLAFQNVEAAIDELAAADASLAKVEVQQGFETQQQSEGIRDIFISMGLAMLIAYVLLSLTFGNILLPLEMLLAMPLAIVGAAVGLTITNRVLGLPAMVGLLMLIGIVITNAIVLLDRVQQNRSLRGMSTTDALVEAGRTRLRPILMTAGTTIIAQLPLATSTEPGVIIAAELGTVVMGGLISSTLLTLFVLPVIYSLVDSLLNATIYRGRRAA